MTVHNSLIVPQLFPSALPDFPPSLEESKTAHTQYSAWSDLRISKQLASDFKVYEDPKNPGFVTLRHLEEMINDKRLPPEVRQFAYELVNRDLFDQLDAGDNKSDNKVSEQSIQDSIVEQRQAKREQPVEQNRPPFGRRDLEYFDPGVVPL
ncbi:hypothetical protein LVW35_21130 [Pseudomonas sp. HN11]|uniref:hypothetical protein n=1 Tax=Pseudomonas sp. HN11 TaxID=1344094 RepID=UPI001F1AA6BA|nr:hypothetical protein [Pseudomonas sp. HN11]UII70149.1 hypothetical protein LVW35_21130 [Pseudomonas sp. HN11]